MIRATCVILEANISWARDYTAAVNIKWKANVCIRYDFGRKWILLAL